MDKIERNNKENFVRNKKKSALRRTLVFLAVSAVTVALGYFLADFISTIVVEYFSAAH